MAYKIVWTENALEDVYSVYDYLQRNWSARVAGKFLDKCIYWINLISNYPDIGRASHKDASIKRVLVSKQNALYYKVESNIIYLIDLIDTRQDPAKNPFE